MTYSVILSEKLNAAKRKEVALALAGHLNLSLVEIMQLLASHPAPLSQSISKTQAEKIVSLIAPLGIEAKLQEDRQDTALSTMISTKTAPSKTASSALDSPKDPKIELSINSVETFRSLGATSRNLEFTEPPKSERLPPLAQLPSLQTFPRASRPKQNTLKKHPELSPELLGKEQDFSLFKPESNQSVSNRKKSSGLKLAISALLGTLALASFLLSLTAFQRFLSSDQNGNLSYNALGSSLNLLPSNNGLIALGVLLVLILQVILSAWRPQARIATLLAWFSLPLLVVLAIIIGLQVAEFII